MHGHIRPQLAMRDYERNLRTREEEKQSRLRARKAGNARGSGAAAGEDAEAVIPLQAAELAVRYLIDSYQVPPDKQMITTGTNLKQLTHALCPPHS